MRVTWEPFESRFKPIEDKFLHHALIVIRSAGVEGSISRYNRLEQKGEAARGSSFPLTSRVLYTHIISNIEKLKNAAQFWLGYRQSTSRISTRLTSRSTLKIPVNGYSSTRISQHGIVHQDQAFCGVTARVRNPFISINSP